MNINPLPLHKQPSRSTSDSYPNDITSDGYTKLSPQLQALLEEILVEATALGHNIRGIVRLRPLLRFPSYSLPGFGNHQKTTSIQITPATRYCGGCANCGMRLILDTELMSPEASARPAWGAALSNPCDSERLRAIETHAFLLGESHMALSFLLQTKIDELPPQQQERFDPGEFDYLRQRWLSDDGLLALQWRLRDNPAIPIGDDNRQGKEGIVQGLRLIPRDELLPAFYYGPRINPNPHQSENEDDWLTVPLETGEPGLAYRDDLGRWRFKREDGTVGFFVVPQHICFASPPTSAPENLTFEELEVEPQHTESTITPDDHLLYP